ncbi:MAG: hypothetical protein KF718_06255 [Polyangiaceae bacterium]|nr:hypothetical protein [Polyangiaceae bacterium]
MSTTNERLCAVVAITLAFSGGGCSSDGGPTAASGSDAGSNCELGGLRFIIALDPEPKITGSPNVWEVTGHIATKTGKGFTLDSCRPSAACSPSLTEVSYDVHGKLSPPDVDWPIGAYVTVRYTSEFYASGSTMATLSVRNLPAWDGAANPVSSSEQWYLLATEGYLTHPQAPFEVTEEAVAGCPRSHAVRIRAPGGEWTTVAQGQSGSVIVDDWSYDLSVVRAYTAPCCDYPPPFAWWATSTPVE